MTVIQCKGCPTIFFPNPSHKMFCTPFCGMIFRKRRDRTTSQIVKLLRAVKDDLNRELRERIP